MSQEREGDPRSDFVGVVWTAGEVVHECQGIGVGVRNLAFLGSWWAQITEQSVDGVVAEFADDESSESKINLQRSESRWSVQWMVDEVGHEGSESPVVGAVLEQVT